MLTISHDRPLVYLTMAFAEGRTKDHGEVNRF